LLASQSAYVVAAARLYLFLIPLSLATQYCMSILQGKMQILRFNFLRVIIPAGYLIGTVALIGTQLLTLKSIIVLHLVLNVGALAAAVFSLLRARIKLGWRADVCLAKEMLRYGFRVQLGDISVLGNQRLDQVMIAAWLSPVQLGLYVAAVSAAGLGRLLATAVRMVVTPTIARKASANERAALAQGVFRRYWGMSLPAAVVIGLLMPIAIPRVFGADFRSAIWVAEILLLGVLLEGAKTVLTGAAQALGRPLLSSRAEVIGLVATCVSLIVLLPLLKIMGAAIASVMASLITLVFITRGLYLSDSISPRNLFRLQGSDFRIPYDQFYGRLAPDKE
jgi:O-antigen/teichoic acid export membrane protein